MHKFIIEEFFKDDYSIIVNTDLDGILSGLILKNYLNCKIVGFCNSEEKVYLNESVSSISSPVYIDMFVSDPFSRSIDVISESSALNKKSINFKPSLILKKSRLIFIPLDSNKPII